MNTDIIELRLVISAHQCHQWFKNPLAVVHQIYLCLNEQVWNHLLR